MRKSISPALILILTSILILISHAHADSEAGLKSTGDLCSKNTECDSGNCLKGICEEPGYCEKDSDCLSGQHCLVNTCINFKQITEHDFLFILWILVMYLVPFVYALVLERVDMSLLGTVILTVPTTIVFPIFIYVMSGHTLPFGSHLIVPPIFILIILWNFFAESFDIRNNFFLSIVNIYPPAAAAMLILLLSGIINFSLILFPLFFVVPAAAYYFLRQLGYVTSCTFIVSYLIFDLYGALIISALLAASIILYKSRFRRVEDAGEISIGETINSGMPVFSYTGFSEVKNYDEIPDDAIDPYTQHKIHELIINGKKIVKCNACETYYDKEILNFYQNSCAVFGCANSKF